MPDKVLALREHCRCQMERAAQALLEDYRSDSERTAFTALDGKAMQEMV